MQLETWHRAGESPISRAFQEVCLFERVQQAPRGGGIDVQDLRDLARRERETGHLQILRPESLQRVREAMGCHRPTGWTAWDMQHKLM